MRTLPARATDRRGLGPQGGPGHLRLTRSQRSRAATGAIPYRSRLAAIPSFGAFADGVRLWQQELLAYFDEPVTNGYAEGVINKIKVIKRRAYGLPTFEGFRRRVLVACA